MTDREAADKRLFDKIAESYVKKDLTTYCRICRKLRLYKTLKNIPKPITTLLEVGCGAGFSADYLRGQYHRFIGLDHSENLIAYAQKYNSSDNTVFICGNIKDLVNCQKFQVILMIGVLHHIPDVQDVLMNLKSYLEPDGLIVVNEPQKGNPLIVFMRKIRKKIDKKYSVDQVEFSEVELSRIFIECGYKTKTFPQGILSTPLAETRILPNFIGIPLALLFRAVDSILEKLISLSVLRKLAWNVVVEARIDVGN